MKTVYGIDIGGTQVKACALNASGEVLGRHSAALGEERNGPERVKESIRILEDQCRQAPDGIGIAAPGLASRGEDRIACLPGGKVAIEGLVWAEFLAIDRPIRVLNDAHAGLLGELWKGAAQGLRNALLITLGTGIGGAILSDGRLLRGHLGRAGHVGHLCLDPEGPPGICGMPGSFEDYIGNQTVEERTHGRFTSTDQLVEAVLKGDAEAVRYWEQSIYHLACGLASLVNVLDPEAIVIGGGIAQAGKVLFEPLQSAMDRVEWRPTGERVMLLQAKLGEWSGAYGAAYNVLTHDREEETKAS